MHPLDIGSYANTLYKYIVCFCILCISIFLYFSVTGCLFVEKKCYILNSRNVLLSQMLLKHFSSKSCKEITNTYWGNISKLISSFIPLIISVGGTLPATQQFIIDSPGNESLSFWRAITKSSILFETRAVSA